MEYAIGAFIRPQTFELCSGVYDSDRGEGTTVVFDDASNNAVIARGAIDDGGYGEKYQVTAKVTGFPRVHATPGVTGAYRGGGWGTPLYVLAASTAFLETQGVVRFAPNTVGSAPGVSSKSGSEGGRSSKANAWWDRARSIGLVSSVNECTESDETEEVEEDFEYSSRRTSSEMDDALTDMLQNDGYDSWESYVVSGTAKKTQEVGEECFDIDILKFDACDKAGLVVSLAEQALHVSADISDCTAVRPEVLRIVNTGYLAAAPTGREVMDQLMIMAKNAGLSQADISSMVARFNERVDAGGVQYTEAVVAQENPRRSRIYKVRAGRRTFLFRENPKRVIVPRKIAPMRPVFYGPRRNPAALPASTQKALAKLHERRVEMGYGALAGLP